MKVNVYDLTGKVVEEVELPSIFNEEIREEIIRRAVLAEESREYQPKGNYRWAGMETSARYVGRKDAYASLKNRGQARLPREFFGGGIPGRVRRIPQAVGGRRAHPPKPWKRIVEKINKKEWLKALRSALAASANKEIVEARHNVSVPSAPIVFVDDIENTKKTKEAEKILRTVIEKDLAKSRRSRKRRTGVRRRKGGYIVRKSALVVLTRETKAFRNIPGVDEVTVENLKVKHLAPGTHPGRILILSKSALKKLQEVYGHED